MRRTNSNNPNVRIQSKPSRHFGTELPVRGGPWDGQTLKYTGRRLRVVGTREEERVICEYQLDWSPKGNRQGYEYYYRWFGPVAERSK